VHWGGVGTRGLVDHPCHDFAWEIRPGGGSGSRAPSGPIIIIIITAASDAKGPGFEPYSDASFTQTSAP